MIASISAWVWVAIPSNTEGFSPSYFKTTLSAPLTEWRKVSKDDSIAASIIPEVTVEKGTVM